MFSGDLAMKGPVNDFWRFNLTSAQWSLIGGNTSFVTIFNYSTKGEVSPDAWPPGKAGAAYWTDSNGNFWVYGGYGPHVPGSLDGFFCGSDIWVYDIRSKFWGWIAGFSTLSFGDSSNPIKSLLSPGSFCYLPSSGTSDGNLIVTGRGSGTPRTFWLWKFSTSSRLWSPISQINDEFTPKMIRERGSLISLGTNLVLVMGGNLDIRNYSYLYTDSWTYHVPSRKWNWISGSCNPSNDILSYSINRGSSSSQMILPSTAFSVMKRRNALFLVGGIRTNVGEQIAVNTILKYSICDGNQFFFRRSML
jgi:hypothetical protein